MLAGDKPSNVRLVLCPQVQDWLNPQGMRTSLPTTVPDHGMPNVNKLRYTRRMPFADALPRDGGPLYGTNTLVGNWTEERNDANYRSGTRGLKRPWFERRMKPARIDIMEVNGNELYVSASSVTVILLLVSGWGSLVNWLCMWVGPTMRCVSKVFLPLLMPLLLVQLK